MMTWWLLATLALAGNEPSPLLPLTHALEAPLDHDGEKVLAYASKCRRGDEGWERSGTMPMTMTQLYDALGRSMWCWQAAEKKAKKVGEPIAPLTAWISGWTRVLETYRGLNWALQAKWQGDVRHICTRLREANKLAELAVAQSIGLPELHPEAVELAGLPPALANQLFGQVRREQEVQHCQQ